MDNPGYQIDLLFDRNDQVITICEVKYMHRKVDASIIPEVDKKISLFNNPKNKTIERVLITVEGANDSVVGQGYFDRILTLDDLFD